MPPKAPVLASHPKQVLKRLWRTHAKPANYSKSSLAAPRSIRAQFDDCHIFKGPTSNGYPVANLPRKAGKKRSAIKLTQLAVFITTGKFVSITGKSATNASHRCHRKLCINPKHIIIEPIPANTHRQTCLGFKQIKVQGKMKWIKACPLEPHCLQTSTAASAFKIAFLE